jgi:glycosyltransferase involved in cell wall biosynthesis
VPYRVLHVLWDSERAGTSIARIVASLHRHIPETDFEISACFVGRDGPLVSDFSGLGIPVRVIPWKHPSRDLAGAVRFATFLSRSRFDLIHFHWGGPKLRRMAKMIGGAKVVFHLHSSVEENRLGRPRRIPTHNSDAVIAVSKSIAASSKHPTTRVIYTGLDFSPLAPRAEDPNLCGCVARLTEVKGVFYLLQAAALLKKDFPSLRVEIAGDGPLRAELQSEADRLELNHQVKFLGWVNPLDQLRARWAVLVQPSLEEGLPLSLLEAMADGIPVVTSRVGGIPEVVCDGATGVLVPAADVNALAAAIRTLLKNATLRHRMGNEAARTVRERFSGQRMAEEIEALYLELLGNHDKR